MLSTKSIIATTSVALTAILAPLLFAQETKEAPASAKPEKEMRIFMFSAKPSAKGWQFMKENPGDRKAATAGAMEKIGGKMLAYYFGLTDGKNYIIAALPDGKTAQAMLVQRLATDMVLEYDAIELVESSAMPAMFERLEEIEAADDSIK
tara:strand:- start:161 stop:610 length:450 start_codon:yes stop_codon:yes gene_type:complete